MVNQLKQPKIINHRQKIKTKLKNKEKDVLFVSLNQSPTEALKEIKKFFNI